MPEPAKIVRIPSLKTVEEFRRHVAALGIELPCDDAIAPGSASPLARPCDTIRINGKIPGNRVAIQPMEGWDGTSDGGVTDDVRRRWRRFGESGAKLICGGEAMAVRPDGRANPNQLILAERHTRALAGLRQQLVEAHVGHHGTDGDLVIGFQLTHSGRFCKPTDRFRMEPRVAYRHPILDARFKVTSDSQVWTDTEIDDLIGDYVRAARVAREAGADFVDLKHCHGYLLHEFLSARSRPGRYGGSFENRTRILRDIVSGIRASGNDIDLAVRLSAFDFVPFKPDPGTSKPGKPGVGVPEEFASLLPYQAAFGANADNPLEMDLSEPFRFAGLCAALGVKILNLSAGSPYYNPHIQRPAAYPPSDGYLPPEDPLIGVARQMRATRCFKQHLSGAAHSTASAGGNAHVAPMLIVGSAYSYLQEYLPHVAQAAVRENWVDVVGLGRVVLSYPGILADAMTRGALASRLICRTFSDCTTAPRNGLASGCYPLDKHYSTRPEFQQLKEIKKGAGV